MERFLTRYVLAPLARTVQLEALAANQRALLLLREGGADADLADALSAGATCWWLLRPAMAKARRQAVRDSVRRQRRLLARSPLPRRKLAQSLERQSAWLGELAAAPPPADRVILDRLVRAYRQARREARRDPDSARLRKRLARLVLCEELLLSAPGPITGKAVPGASARRRCLERMRRSADGGRVEDRALRRSEDDRRSRRAVLELAVEAFDATPEAYRAGLAPALWFRHRPQPVALASGSGQGGEIP